MKYIKHQGKFYKIERELTEGEVNEHKISLQKHIDTLEDRRKAWAKIQEEEATKNKEKAIAELQELKSLK